MESQTPLPIGLTRGGKWEPGSFLYAPVLLNRSGELNALKRAKVEELDLMMPIIRVVGPKSSTRVVREERIRNWILQIAEAIDGAPIYLDFHRCDPGRIVTTNSEAIPILSLLHRQARRNRVNFVPVIQIGAKASSVAMRVTRETVCIDGRGACICYPAGLILTAGETREKLLVSALDSVGVNAEETDLWVDFGYLNPDRVILAPFAATMLNELFAVADWRRVIFTGTSMPPMLGGIARGTVGVVDRREWVLWNGLKKTNVTRMPIFGDYAIQNPAPPAEGRVTNMRANVRYTAPDKTLISRGTNPIYPDGADEYGELCRRLIATYQVFPPGYSWGDRVIRNHADGLDASGSQSFWRGVGTSHHLMLVTDQLTGSQWLADGGLGQDLPRLYG